MKLRRLFVSAFASALAFGVSSVGTNAAPFDPIGSLEVTGTFGTTGQTLSGTLAFSGFLVSGANISISGVSGVFDVVLGQDGFKDTPTVINPNPPQEWVVAIRDSSNNFRMGMFFTILDLGPNPTFITQILGPIVDGNYINPPVDCLPACTTHSADSLTGSFSLVPQVPGTPLIAPNIVQTKKPRPMCRGFSLVAHVRYWHLADIATPSCTKTS